MCDSEMPDAQTGAPSAPATPGSAAAAATLHATVSSATRPPRDRLIVDDFVGYYALGRDVQKLGPQIYSRGRDSMVNVLQQRTSHDERLALKATVEERGRRLGTAIASFSSSAEHFNGTRSYYETKLEEVKVELTNARTNIYRVTHDDMRKDKEGTREDARMSEDPPETWTDGMDATFNRGFDKVSNEMTVNTSPALTHLAALYLISDALQKTLDQLPEYTLIPQGNGPIETAQTSPSPITNAFSTPVMSIVAPVLQDNGPTESASRDPDPTNTCPRTMPGVTGTHVGVDPLKDDEFNSLLEFVTEGITNVEVDASDGGGGDGNEMNLDP